VWGNGPPIGDAGNCQAGGESEANGGKSEANGGETGGGGGGSSISSSSSSSSSGGGGGSGGIGGDGGGGGEIVLDIQTKYVQTSGPWKGVPMTCTDANDTEALNDADDSSLPQNTPQQRVEYDHRLATRTIESLHRVKRLGVPAFIAVGFRRPHLAWRMPKRFWALYNGTDSRPLDLPSNRHFSPNVTELAYGVNSPPEQPYGLAEMRSHSSRQRQAGHGIAGGSQLR
jgi:hypothetical protein